MDLSASCDPLKISSGAQDRLSHLVGAGTALALPVSRACNFHLFCTDSVQFQQLFCAIFKEETKDVAGRIVVSLPLVVINEFPG